MDRVLPKNRVQGDLVRPFLVIFAFLDDFR